jgi:membrane associated rhomboid family serine protease
MSLKTSLVTSLKIYFKLVALILIINLIFEILLVLFNPSTVSYFFIWNPFINSFIHTSWEHLAYNLVALFLFLLPRINHSLGFKNILFITTLIALICFPFELLQWSLPIVGISGMFYFLMTRFVLSIKRYKLLFRIIFCLLIVGEISLTGNNDSISHFSHLTGVLLGFVDHFNYPIYFSKRIQQQKIVQ